MSIYHHLKVKEVIRETSDAVTLVLENNPPIAYRSGQFLTVILTLNGEKIRRSYSLSSCFGLDKDLAITVKRIDGGKASTYLTTQVKAGDMLEVMQPLGAFSLEAQKGPARDIVLIGAGSGITPLMSMLKLILHHEPGSKVYLLYGNRNEDQIIFKSKLEQIQKQFPSTLAIQQPLTRPNQSNYQPQGRLEGTTIDSLLKNFNGLNLSKALYYLCGPEGMMEEAKKALGRLQVSADQIRIESFYNAPSETKDSPAPEVKGNVDEVKIIYQGQEHMVKVKPNKSILESALDMKIDLPYSCQSGLCTACMGKCLSGEVYMNDPDGLSDKEIKNGMVLPCVSKPVTPGVVIQID